jgi:hypothetical protein
MVDQANENARREARKRGLKSVPQNLVFREEIGD